MDLNINIEERLYGGKKFRPSTFVDLEKSNNLLLCITSWGQHDLGKKVAESIKSFISLSNDDTDMTTIYSAKQNLNKISNSLRMSVISASEKVFNEYNKDEYTSGFEIFAAIQDGPQWFFVSCGQPSLIIKRDSLGLVPVSQSIDLNVLTTKAVVLDPLPNHVLGLGQHPPIQHGNIALRSTDQLLLVSRTYLPNSFFKLGSEDLSPERVSNVLADDNPDVPFWLGLINFN